METIKERKLNEFRFRQRIEESLSVKLGIPSLKAGGIVIRDERDWRINEKQIEYCWLVSIETSFDGWCWLFTLKFNETKFRDNNNPEELVQGIFTTDKEGAINHYYRESRDLNYRDKIREVTVYDMFDANTGITLDGVGYKYIIFAPNTEIVIALNNPNSDNWRIWEKAVWELGRELSATSDSKVMQNIFNANGYRQEDIKEDYKLKLRPED